MRKKLTLLEQEQQDWERSKWSRLATPAAREADRQRVLAWREQHDLSLLPGAGVWSPPRLRRALWFLKDPLAVSRMGKQDARVFYNRRLKDPSYSLHLAADDG